MNEVILLVISIVAGFLGSILGIGGGLIIIPMLTLVFHIDIRYAIAASLLSIVATSSSAAAVFLKDHLTNIRIAVLLEIGTVFGAITGFLISAYIASSMLYFLFAFFLLFSATMMLRKREDSPAEEAHPWADALQLNSFYPNEKGEAVFYKVAHVPLGLLCMYIAGVLSALLGIGSGILKVLAMDGAMKLPMKVSSATSNFMIGVTATASAGAYFIRGDIQPQIVAPVILGIIIGSSFGSRALLRMKASLLRKIFVILLTVVALQMIFKGFNV